MKPKILLLSGYDAESHQQWRQRLANNLNEFEWTQLTLAPRHFSWRTRGSSLNFAFSYAEELSRHYDLIIATSMVDLASLRGFVPQIATIPTVVYFHENQFVYPISNAQPNIVNAQLTSVYSALCADKVVFNSQYNLDSFFAGASALFARLPDKVPPGLIENMAKKSQVLAVPIEDPVSNIDKVNENNRLISLVNGQPMHIVWNHRWEYDKQPEVFFDAISYLKHSGIPVKLHVLGQSFRQVPECFVKARECFCEEIETWGYQPEGNYRDILSNAHVVVSTALHDFQGLSMLEAIRAGCIPIAPQRVAYPEYVASSLLYETGSSVADESRHLSDLLVEIYSQYNTRLPDVSSYFLSQLLPKYRALLLETIKSAD